MAQEVDVPDYSACRNRTCPRRLACARYRMAWGHWQSMASFKAEGCTHFFPLEGAPFHFVSEDEADVRNEHAPDAP